MTESNEKKNAKRKKIPKPEQMAGDITQFEISKGLNKYGFIHVPKAAREFLPFNESEPLKARIEGKTLILEKQQEKASPSA